MAGVNNVSTYDNAPENSNNAVVCTNKADDSDDNELSKHLDECDTPVDRVKCSVDIMLAAESIHSDSLNKQSDDVVEYTDLKSLQSNEYQLQKDTCQLFLLTEKQHTDETNHSGLGSDIVLELDPLKSDIDNDCQSFDNMSSGFEDGVTREFEDKDLVCAELEEPRIFTRPLPVDESDNVTELVFDTWTTVEEFVESEVPKIESNSDKKTTEDISSANLNQECFDINTPAVVNSVVSVCLINN